MYSMCHLQRQRPGLLRSLHLRIYRDFRDTYKILFGNLLNYKQLDLVHLKFLLLLKTARRPRYRCMGGRRARGVWRCNCPALHGVVSPDSQRSGDLGLVKKVPFPFRKIQTAAFLHMVVSAFLETGLGPCVTTPPKTCSHNAHAITWEVISHVAPRRPSERWQRTAVGWRTGEHTLKS